MSSVPDSSVPSAADSFFAFALLLAPVEVLGEDGLVGRVASTGPSTSRSAISSRALFSSTWRRST